LPKLRLHDLRHTFGTLAVQAFPLSDVKACVGHADIQTTMNDGPLRNFFVAVVPSAGRPEPSRCRRYPVTFGRLCETTFGFFLCFFAFTFAFFVAFVTFFGVKGALLVVVVAAVVAAEVVVVPDTVAVVVAGSVGVETVVVTGATRVQ
jgi:hypothetical protein